MTIKQVLSLDTLYPGTYIAILTRLLNDRGVDTDSLLACHQLERAQLLDPQYQLSIGRALEIIHHCIQLYPSPELAFEFGQRIHMASHGDVGVASLASDTLSGSLDVMVEFTQSRLPFLKIEKQVNQHSVTVRMHELLDFESLRQFNMECYLASTFTTCRSIGLAEQVKNWCVTLSYDRPANAEYYEKYLSAHCEFNAAFNDVIFDRSLLDHPMPMRSASLCRLAISRLPTTAGLDSQSETEAVREMIGAQLQDGISLADSAESLHMSSRTLMRKLSAQGTSFKQLLEHVRNKRACHLLQHTHIQADAIASRLGYSEPANFTRAFKKWQGMTPRHYRQQRSSMTAVTNKVKSN